MTRITILGTGFAALTAIRELRKQRVDAEITVVSPRDSLVYLPSLIWMPAGMRNGGELTVPLAGFFARNKVKWHPGAVETVEDGG
ncbi:MAG: NAD(P)/FAD-dependent oxidoreductase, partial [Salaquimonas sp.]|nr:NAD(P)/FAD-dependent oxidoreductase [Salaquimonas sp.]